MLLFVPGFTQGLRYSISLNIEHGTNLPLPWPWPWMPYPWPWTDAPQPLEAWETFCMLTRVAAFLLPVIAVPALAWTIARSRREAWRARAPLVGATLVGTVYMHYAVVRSDMLHLANCVVPLLLALLVAPGALGAGRIWKACLWSALATLSLAATVTWHETLGVHAQQRELTQYTVAGERLQLIPAQAKYLAALERAVQRHVGDARLFIAPYRSALYCVLGKTSPTWWIYHFWKVPADEQEATIAALAERGYDWALIVDVPIDGREELLFRNTNSLVWAHLQRDWVRVPTPGLPADNLLLRRR
jgi:hypothetical protein